MFVAGMNVRGTQLRGIFVAADRTDAQGLPEVDLITAANGDMHLDPQSGARYLVLHDGHRYVGVRVSPIGSCWIFAVTIYHWPKSMPALEVPISPYTNAVPWPS